MHTELPEAPPTAEATDETAVEAAQTSPEVLAGSLWEYVQIWVRRVRSGQSGALPVLLGLLGIVIFFQAKNSLFLSSGNLVLLATQGAAFIVLGFAEVFVLLLGEIDLSVGYNAAIGAVCMAWAAFTLPWWVAILIGLGASTLFGLIQGTIIARLRVPSFVVTLAGLLGLEGLLIDLTSWSHHGAGGSIPINNTVINDISNGNVDPTLGWILMIVLVAVYGGFMVVRDARRRAGGLVAPPISITATKVGAVAVAGVVVVLIGNSNRGTGFTKVEGVPWVVGIVVAILTLWTILLSRTRFGRYMYAIGGNAEAARRAGVSLPFIRTVAFMLSGLTAAAAGIIYASRLGSIGTNVDGGQLVLFAVAAAVIGGTHLFGGVGKMLHALLGGIVVAAIDNGLGLLGSGAATTDIVTALVLLAAVTVDTLARRGSQGA